MPRPDPHYLRRYTGYLKLTKSAGAEFIGNICIERLWPEMPQFARERRIPGGVLLFDILAYNYEQAVALLEEFVGDGRHVRAADNMKLCRRLLAERQAELLDEPRRQVFIYHK